MEVETQLRIANALGYIADAETQNLLAQAAEIGRILNGLINAVGDQTDAAAAAHLSR